MTTSNKGSVLKDVVAYVDVWSSDKMANYSQPFVQQLLEMGAQVSKTFNKQVTHVVFNSGHTATWRKAKKSDVKLVSLLWVGRCYDDGVHVDEELFPAFNDESNPVLKNRKHRCMRPKDNPEMTSANNKRMRKKLDKMMKDLPPKQPIVHDASPIIIDEKSGIIYSPALKRSEYMAQRLNDMKRENLSLAASPKGESSAPSELKPSLGSTPTVLKLMFDESDEDSSVSAAEPAYSPDKEEGRTQVSVTNHDQQHHRKGSLCHDGPKWISSPVSPGKCPDFKDEKGNGQKKSRRTSVRKKPTEKHKSIGLLESPRKSSDSKESKDLHEEKRLSQIKSLTPSPSKTGKGKWRVKGAESVTETKTHFCSDAANTTSCLSPSAKLVDTAIELSKEPTTPLQKIPRRSRQSLSAFVQSFIRPSDSKSVVSGSTDEDDNVFEDYFSPANCLPRSKRLTLPNLPVERDILIPFELDSKKRKLRRSESVGSETNSKKKKTAEKREQPHENIEPQSVPQQDVKESLPASERPRVDVTLVAKRRRQSTLSFPSTSSTTSAVKRRRTCSLLQPTTSTEVKLISELQQNSDVNVLSHTLESRGNTLTVAAGLTEIPSEGKEENNKQVSLSLRNMVNGAKAMRTLVMTSMPTEKQHTLVQVVTTLGGFSIVDQVCDSTTHVVSGGHRRTLNILLGIARGCWILSFEWILWSLEQRQWIPEEPYELSDQYPAAQICRLQRHLSAGEHQQDLFQGQPAMFVSQQSQPPTQSLVELIQLCGGTVCKSVRQAGICIGKYGGRRPEGSRILSEQWVLDSITHLKRLSYDNYDLE